MIKVDSDHLERLGDVGGEVPVEALQAVEINAAINRCPLPCPWTRPPPSTYIFLQRDQCLFKGRVQRFNFSSLLYAAQAAQRIRIDINKMSKEKVVITSAFRE